MEFFHFLPLAVSPDRLREILTIGAMSRHWASVDRVLSDGGDAAEICCLWGRFRVQRAVINGGVRFSMPDCPNALAWTLTTGLPPDPGRVVIHASINRTGHDPDFIESIGLFMDDWDQGLRRAIAEPPPPARRIR